MRIPQSPHNHRDPPFVIPIILIVVESPFIPVQSPAKFLFSLATQNSKGRTSSKTLDIQNLQGVFECCHYHHYHHYHLLLLLLLLLLLHFHGL